MTGLLDSCFQLEVIHALAILKKAAAIVNKDYGLDPSIADIIVKVAEEVGVTASPCGWTSILYRELKYIDL